MLVRLKVATPTVLRTETRSFNSMLVRLKATTADHRAIVITFQFHAGSIKRIGSGGGIIAVSRFQFHAGSIKSARASGVFGDQQARFQFHAGSIKSFVTRPFTSAIFSFNSMLVRLKAARTTGRTRDRVWFQFHAGSIKRCQRHGCTRYTQRQVSIPCWFD